MRYPLLLSLLAALVALLFVASLLIGPAGISVSDSLAALFTGGAQAEVLVMREIRLPRTLLAAMIGAALGLAGAALCKAGCAIRWPSRAFWGHRPQRRLGR
ncbi:ABC cobalamin/Fe3+-siderophore transporter, inner membrane subunit [Ketogulonicigenium vulgare Y25]|nr:ABC cobalamin/Fe3+-siderophore transporter, inner membrane subunit [Ketogulonicigenium vulgare Y25]